jgi:hypothetical protein
LSLEGLPYHNQSKYGNNQILTNLLQIISTGFLNVAEEKMRRPQKILQWPNFGRIYQKSGRKVAEEIFTNVIFVKI